jgi:hypothetical protein
MDNIKAPACACGCGKPTKKNRRGKFNKFLLGHNPKHQGHSKPAKTGRNSGQFASGISGNPGGRKQGSRNKVTITAANILESQAAAISETAVGMALDGDRSMIKMVLERVVPVKKSVPIRLPDMPKVNSVADASKLTGFVLTSIAEGELSPVDGEVISRSCQRHLQALQVSDLEQRLVELENQLKGQGDSA